jgi:hypothetical protein
VEESRERAREWEIFEVLATNPEGPADGSEPTETPEIDDSFIDWNASDIEWMDPQIAL